MKKKILGMLGAMCMALVMMPMTVRADAPAQSVNIGGVTLNAETPHYHNGTDGAVGTADADSTNANATFDASTGTLTLNNLNVETSGTGARGIEWRPGEDDNDYNRVLTIILADSTTNAVSSPGGHGIYGGFGVVTGSGPSVVIGGSGTLNINAKCGFWVWKSVTIQDTAKVNVVNNNDIGICNNSDRGVITIKDNAKVDIQNASYGVGFSNNHTNSMQIKGGTLTIAATTAAFQATPTLDNSKLWTVNVGADAGGATTWDSTTDLKNYKYVSIVYAGEKPSLTGTASISGTAVYGEVLTAALADSNNTGTLTYTWKAGDTVLQESTGNTYTINSESAIGKTITVTVTSSSHSGSVTSQPTAAVAKKEAASAPANLQGVKPGTAGGADGKITGTDTSMEYSTTADFASKAGCGNTETTGLAAGTYYVRYAETATVKASNYVTVVVPDVVTHSHSWSATWNNNESHHWHNCEGTGVCDITADSAKNGYGEHIYDNDADTTCNNCEYTRTLSGGESGGENNSGTVENNTNQETNECKATLEESSADLSSKVLTADDQQKVTSGKDVKIWLEVTAGESKVTDTEKGLTQSKLGDYTLGKYLDLILWKQFDGETAGKVEETSQTVTVKFAVPQDLINTDTNKTRTYQIIRIHDDGTGAKAEVLSSSFDVATGVISFETDKFSIYSLSYKDTVNITDNGNNNNSSDDGDDNSDSTDNEVSENTNSGDEWDAVPKTGEKNSVMAWLFLALISGIGAVYFRQKQSKDL